MKNTAILALAAASLSACIIIGDDEETGGLLVSSPDGGFFGLRDPYANTGQHVFIGNQRIPIIQRRDKDGRPQGDWLVRVNGQVEACGGKRLLRCQDAADRLAAQQARDEGGGHSH